MRTAGKKGSYSEIRPGVWRVRAVTGYTDKLVGGKVKKIPVQINKTVHGTEQDAKDETVRLRDQAEKETPAGSETVGHFLDRYLAWLPSQEYSPTTVVSHIQTARTNITPYVGGIKLAALTSADVEAMDAKLAERGLSVGSRNRAKAVLSGALSDAKRRGMVGTNVCRDARVPNPKRKHHEVPSKGDIKKLLDAGYKLSRDVGDAMTMLALTGCRRGELVGIRYGDWNVANNTLTIRRSIFNKEGGGAGVKGTKTGVVRQIEIDEVAVAILSARLADIRDEVEASGTGHADRYVFAQKGTQGNEPMLPSFLTFHFIQAAKASGVKAHVHLLRHWSATMQLQAGVTPTEVSKRLGHSSVTTTMNVYSHVIPGQDKAAAALLGKLVGHREEEPSKTS